MSSGAPPAAIAIMRISGPAAFAAGERIAGPLPPPRRAALRRLRDRLGATLDHALVLTFPAATSATGEDVVELHCHGGRAVVAAIDTTLTAIPGLRRAEAGEFSRRALLSGRIDLTQAEALGDLLCAETEAERIAAIAGVEGAVGQQVARWSQRITELAARVEAAIDYDEEGDVAAGAAGIEAIGTAMTSLRREMEEALAAPSVERLRDGYRIVLAGPRNAGKSTLLNLLAGREAAIVSPIAGTTRDRIEAPVQRAGIAYLLVDTAGLAEETNDPIEAIGIGRARQAVGAADLTLWLGDEHPGFGNALWLWPRADIPGRETAPDGAIAISRDDAGSLMRLWAVIADRLGNSTSSRVALNERQRERVAEAAVCLSGSTDPILVAENLRISSAALTAISRFDRADAVLDALFAQFCVGK